MGLAELAAEHLAMRTEQVARETWGHMDANPGTRYRGHVVFAHGAYGDVVVLDVDFGNAGYGPWFYKGVHDWAAGQKTKPGKVYRFDGTYRLAVGGAHVFDGQVTPMTITFAQ